MEAKTHAHNVSIKCNPHTLMIYNSHCIDSKFGISLRSLVCKYIYLGRATWDGLAFSQRFDRSTVEQKEFRDSHADWD